MGLENGEKGEEGAPGLPLPGGMHHLANIPAFDDDGLLNVVIETPKGGRFV